MLCFVLQENSAHRTWATRGLWSHCISSAHVPLGNSGKRFTPLVLRLCAVSRGYIWYKRPTERDPGRCTLAPVRLDAGTQRRWVQIVDADADDGCPRSAVAVLDVSALRARRRHSPSCSSVGAEAGHGRSLRPLVNPREPHVGDRRDAGACLICCRNAAVMTNALPGCLPMRAYCVNLCSHRNTKFIVN